VVLILAALTGTLTMAAPTMCLPVLFPEIAAELGLSLVQIGVVWGIGSLAGILTGLAGGAISDRLGAVRTLRMATLLVGPIGALRGLSTDLVSLAVTVFLFSLVTPFVMMSLTKICGLWFSRRQLGLANGVITMGAALGFMLTSMISATVLSPWLGGWRHVLFFWGGIALVISIGWHLARIAPDRGAVPSGETGVLSLRQTMAYVARIRNVWLLGLVMLGVGSCVESALGYLPLYLRGLGWAETAADGALSAFHAASMICVLPIALWSDRLGARKKVLTGTALMIMTGMGLLTFVDGMVVWGAVIMAGMVRDGFMAVFITTVIETEGVGAAYAGTAMGLVAIFSGTGRLISPPLGNSLAAISPSLPFLFWACLAVGGLLAIQLVKEGSGSSVTAAEGSPAFSETLD
jgi:MFS family permease